MKKRETRKASAKDLDRMFDQGDDQIDEFFDYDNARTFEPANVLVSFPRWMLLALDREAKRLGINRQAVIKMLIDESLRLRGTRPPKQETA